MKKKKNEIQNPFGSTIISNRITMHGVQMKAYNLTSNGENEIVKIFGFELSLLFHQTQSSLNYYAGLNHNGNEKQIGLFSVHSTFCAMNLNAKGKSYHASSTQSMKPSPATVICGLLFRD